MKHSQIIDLYRRGSQALPGASTDARILAAARTTQSQRPLRFAAAAAVALAAILVVRWMLPGTPTEADPTVSDFGVAEGQASAWLTTYQPSATSTGFGSQEGLP